MCSYCVIVSLQWSARNSFENLVQRRKKKGEKKTKKREKKEGEKGRETTREKLPCRL